MSLAGLRIGFLADCPEATPVLAAWICDVWPLECSGGPPATARLIDGWRGRDRLPLALIAVDGPTPHGFVALVPGSSPQGNDVVLLSTLLVRASARGRGVGRALCAAARVTASRLGIAALHLYTVDAGSYFRHLGWRFLSHAILGPAHRPYGASFMWIETAKRGEPCP